MNESFENALAEEIVFKLSVVDGLMVVPEELLLSLMAHIQTEPDRQRVAATLIATATRLKSISGSSMVTDQLIALAAVALGEGTIQLLNVHGAFGP